MFSGQTHFAIKLIESLQPQDLDELIAESEQQGFEFLRRLIDDWSSGTNRFDQSGEALLVANHGRRIVGVCGLNIDPYAGSSTIGRVRHLYVLHAFRRQRIGTKLVETVISLAQGTFSSLHLYTATKEAGRFYTALGFSETNRFDRCSHILELDL
ncbi:MAG: GNAT family N-acetyltransferase [Planctomycetaceae bacterium]